MKKLLLLSAFLLSTQVFSQGTETRKVSSFIKLETGGSFDVVIEKGNEESVKIVAEGIDPKKIITEVEGDALKVYLEKGHYNNIKTKVFITYKNLKEIVNSGSGNLSCLSDLSAPDFKLRKSGSGNVSIRGKIKASQSHFIISGSGETELAYLETDDLQVSISGSGEITVSSGYAEKQSLSISGSGRIKFFGMKSGICSIEASGSGKAEVNADKSLEVTISGSGNVDYKGNAQIKANKISGSGKINKE